MEGKRIEVLRGLAPKLADMVPPEVLARRHVLTMDEPMLRSLHESVALGDTEDALDYMMDYHGFQGKLRKLLEEMAECTKATTGLMDGRGTFEEWLAELMDVGLVVEQIVRRLAAHAPEFMVLARKVRKEKIHKALLAISVEQEQAWLHLQEVDPETILRPGYTEGGE